MTFMEIKNRREEAISAAERDYEDTLKKIFAEKSHADICVEIINGFISEDPYIGQVFDCPSQWDHPEYIYGNWTSGEDIRWSISVDKGNGYFDIVGLERDEYDDIKAKLGDKIKCEW